MIGVLWSEFPEWTAKFPERKGTGERWIWEPVFTAAARCLF